MKRIIFTLCFSALGILAQAQNSMVQTGDMEVPEAVKTTFVEKFGNVPATWVKSGMEFEAMIKKDGKPLHTFYSPDGTFAGTEEAADISAFPESARNHVNAAVSSEKYSLVATRKRTLPDESTQWIALLQMQNGSMLRLFYDTTGKLVRRSL